jgi:hypothetical protein
MQTCGDAATYNGNVGEGNHDDWRSLCSNMLVKILPGELPF